MANKLDHFHLCHLLYFGSKLVDMDPLVNFLYLVDVFSYSLQIDVALKKSKQDVNGGLPLALKT